MSHFIQMLNEFVPLPVWIGWLALDILALVLDLFFRRQEKKAGKRGRIDYRRYVAVTMTIIFVMTPIFLTGLVSAWIWTWGAFELRAIAVVGPIVAGAIFFLVATSIANENFGLWSQYSNEANKDFRDNLVGWEVNILMGWGLIAVALLLVWVGRVFVPWGTIWGFVIGLPIMVKSVLATWLILAIHKAIAENNLKKRFGLIEADYKSRINFRDESISELRQQLAEIDREKRAKSLGIRVEQLFDSTLDILFLSKSEQQVFSAKIREFESFNYHPDEAKKAWLVTTRDGQLGTYIVGAYSINGWKAWGHILSKNAVIYIADQWGSKTQISAENEEGIATALRIMSTYKTLGEYAYSYRSDELDPVFRAKRSMDDPFHVMLKKAKELNSLPLPELVLGFEKTLFPDLGIQAYVRANNEHVQKKKIK